MPDLIQQEWVREASEQLKILIAKAGGVKGREEDSLFYFLFTDEDRDMQHLYGFIINKSCAQTVIDFHEMVWEEDNSDPFLDLTAGFETTYGVHDWSSSPTDNVDGIGYTSYEVEPDKYIECMTFWRNEMANLLGEDNISQVAHVLSYSVSEDSDLSDAEKASGWTDEDILREVKERLAGTNHKAGLKI